MTSKEMLAIRYNFFRFPSHYALTIIPVVTGIISVILFQQSPEELTTDVWEVIENNQFELIERYLIFSKMALTLVASFFIAFKWSNMELDGSYGFWLTQRVGRGSFYLRAVSLFIVEIYLAMLIGVALLFYPVGIRIPANELFQLLILLLIQIIIIVLGGIFTAEIIPNAEIAAFTFLFAGSLNLLLNSNESNIVHKILKADLHFQDSNQLIPMVSSAILAMTLLILSFLIHTRRSVDL